MACTCVWKLERCLVAHVPVKTKAICCVCVMDASQSDYMN